MSAQSLKFKQNGKFKIYFENGNNVTTHRMMEQGHKA